jgi:hypothetical protein
MTPSTPELIERKKVGEKERRKQKKQKQECEIISLTNWLKY